MCLDLWLSSARCACGGRLGGWGPRSYTSISDVGNAVYFARSITLHAHGRLSDTWISRLLAYLSLKLT